MRNIQFIKKKYLAILCILVLIVTILPAMNSVYAQSSSEKQIKKLVGQMNGYEQYLVHSQTLTSNKKNVSLTKQNMATAAALSLSTDTLVAYGKKGEFGGTVTWKLTNKKLQKTTQNLFGKKLKTSNLRKITNTDDIIYAGDAYRDHKGIPVVYYTDGETESDYVVISISISKIKGKANTYKAVKNIYCGYWGSNTGKPNYKFTYTVKKNSNSSYGYIISNIAVKQIPIN